MAFNDNGGLSLNAWINISVKPRFGGGSRGMVLDTVCWLCHKFSFGIEVEIGLRVERSFPQQSLDVCHAWQLHTLGESRDGNAVRRDVHPFLHRDIIAFLLLVGSLRRYADLVARVDGKSHDDDGFFDFLLHRFRVFLSVAIGVRQFDVCHGEQVLARFVANGHDQLFFFLRRFGTFFVAAAGVEAQQACERKEDEGVNFSE